MKKSLLFISLLLPIFFIGCSDNDETDPKPIPPVGETTVYVKATIPFDNIFWEAGDEVVINGKTKALVEVERSSEYTFVVSDVEAPVVLISPASVQTGFSSFTLEDTQAYTPESFDRSCFVLYGCAWEFIPKNGGDEENVEHAEMQMRQFSGVYTVPVQIEASQAEENVTIKNIELTSNDANASLAGTFEVKYLNDGITIIPENTVNSLQLVCDEGVAIQKGAPVNFKFSLPVGQYNGGFEFVLTDTENRKYVVTTTQDVTIVEGEEYVADTIDYVIVNKQPTTLAVTIADEMVKWNPSDKLVVNGTISSNTAADYAGTSTANFDYASVAYPYSAFYPSYLYSSTGSLRFYPEQPLANGEYDRMSLAMVGYSTTTDVTLYNVCGILTIPITNGYESSDLTLYKVVLSAVNGESLSGKFHINYKNHSLRAVNTSEKLTLHNELGLKIPIGETILCQVVVPATALSQGLNVEITTDQATDTFQTEPAEVRAGSETKLNEIKYVEVKVDSIDTPELLESFLAAVENGRYNRFKGEDGKVHISKDIDCSTLVLEPVTNFTADLDLGGCTISNLSNTFITTLDGSISNGSFSAIAGTLPLIDTVNGTLENVTLKSSSMEVPVINTVNGTVSNLTPDGIYMKDALVNNVTATGVVKDINIPKNITVEYDVPTVARNFGIVANTNAGLVDNCTSAYNMDIVLASLPKLEMNFGAIVGSCSGLISNCKNTGSRVLEVTAPTSGTFHTFGGVVGQYSGAKETVHVQNCTNEGEIHMTIGTACYFFVGGVCGGTPAAKSTPGNYGILDNCVNKGNVTFTYLMGGSGAYPNIGGVVAYVEGTITNVENFGNILQDNRMGTADATWTNSNVGGIAGYVSISAANGKNHGTITVKGNYAGGTAGNRGSANTSSSAWAGCIGKVGPYSGGTNKNLFENFENDANLELTPNSVTMTPNSYFAGVIGYATGKVSNCHNKAKSFIVRMPEASNHVGGVLGGTTCDVVDCSNVADVTFDNGIGNNAKRYVNLGGVIGDMTTASAVTNCTNSGKVTAVDAAATTSSSTDSFCAGILGYRKSTSVVFTNCVNTGSIDVSGWNTKINTGSIFGGEPVE